MTFVEAASWILGLLLGPEPSPAPGALPPAAPYVQAAAPTAFSVLWRPERPTPATLRLKDLTGLGPERAYPAPPAAFHRWRLTGLTPGARYRYAIECPGRPALVAETRTLPGPASDHLRFAVFGDMGSGGPTQRAVGDRLNAWDPDLVLAAGDIVYPGGEASRFGPAYFAPYAAWLGRRCVFPVLGNHDVRTANGAPYLEAFELPDEAGTERYYAFDAGPARFWMLDSTQPLEPGSPQWRWLTADVAAHPAPRARFACFHHPVFSSGLHGSTPALRPLRAFFAAKRFAAVFSGHDHHFERSEPLEGGVTYFVSGGGGATTYPPRNGMPGSAVAISAFHFLGVSLSGSELAVVARTPAGRVLDAWHRRLPR